MPVFKDHGLVSIQAALPAPIQTRCSLRSVPALPPLRSPTSSDQRPRCKLDIAFRTALAQGLEIAENLGHEIPKAGTERGKIQFHDQRRHPRAIGPHASTLHTRRIFKAINQAIEVTKAKAGYRRDITWNNIQHSLRFLSPEQFKPLSEYLNNSASPDSAHAILPILRKILADSIQEDKKQRISRWKARLRASESEQFVWLKNRHKHRPVSLTVVDHVTTANSHARLDAIASVWKKIYSPTKKASLRLMLSSKNTVSI